MAKKRSEHSHKKNRSKEDESSKETQAATEPTDDTVEKKSKDTEKKTKQVKKGSWVQKHQRLIILVLAVVLVLAGFGIATAAYLNQPEVAATKTVTQPKKEKAPEPEPTEIPRRIDGVVVERAKANDLPACAMIENAAFGGVRPQAGLSNANVVYEVIVEGGITRLMAVFAADMPETVGPIRSARDTYLEFASEYNCPYAHAGGSYTALLNIPKLGIRDVNALIDSQYFYRDSRKHNPHNLFAKGDKFDLATSGHGWEDEPSTYESWNFLDDTEITETNTAKSASIDFGGSYNVKYVYKEENKNYERFNGNVPHTDANNGNILTAKNIVIQKVAEGISVEGKGRVNWSVTGTSGEALIIRNGLVTKGTWSKPDRVARTVYKDADGNNIAFGRGTTWVEIVPPHIGVTIE